MIQCLEIAGVTFMVEPGAGGTRLTVLLGDVDAPSTEIIVTLLHDDVDALVCLLQGKQVEPNRVQP